VDVAGRELVLAVSGTGRIDAGRLVGLVSDPASGIRVTPDHRIFAPVPREGGAEVADAARNLLLRLGA
jgi:hypothetical protein